MEALPRNAYMLFNGNSRYVIPPFQRPYVWEQDSQWQPLWSDVQEVASAILEEGGAPAAQHFLGAIVLKHESIRQGESVPWLVIDGQQRLVTLQLLLDATEYEFRALGPDLLRETARLRRLVASDEEEIDPADPDSEFKVKTTSADQDSFRAAMKDDASTSKHSGSLVVRAHDYFRQQVRGWLATDPDNVVERAEALSLALRERLMVVAIGLGTDDNPNLIFETLNARGTPLLAWDLVKNELLYRAEHAGDHPDAFHSEFVRPIEEDLWWREYVRQGSIYAPRIDACLFYWLTLRTEHFVQSDDIYSTLKGYLKGKSVREVAADLVTVASAYRTIETHSHHSGLGRFLQRWRATDSRLITPHLLWLLLNAVEERTLHRCLVAFESFLVRRIVCRASSAGLNRALIPLLSSLRQHGAENADRTIEEFLTSLTPARLAWPDDDTFRVSLMRNPLYEQLNHARMRMILEALNARIDEDADAVIVERQELFIEHVMPQKWQIHYKLTPEPDGEDDPRVQRRESLLHTIGNLSLTTSKVGIKMSAGSWETKREYLSQAGLALNHDLVSSAPDRWDEDAITKRGERLADLALETWPRPEGRFRLL